jgi:Uma2 family endonuclease
MGMPLTRWSLAKYLAWENEQVERHEFHRGEVFAMVGGRRSHGRVVLNLARHLMDQLEGSPCQVFNESMKVQVGEDTILYPDVFVTCDPADLATEMIFRAPTLVIEVLSPSTQAFDRSLEFAGYRRLASLREDILVDPETRRVEAFRRDSDAAGGADRWVLDDMSGSDTLRTPSVGCAMTMAQVYAGLEPAGG